MPPVYQTKGGESVEADRELMLEDARSIREGLWRMARYAHDAAEALDSRIEDEDLDGLAEAVEVRAALERLQALSLEVGEELNAYQKRHPR
jgi:hypothetical protein